MHSLAFETIPSSYICPSKLPETDTACYLLAEIVLFSWMIGNDNITANQLHVLEIIFPAITLDKVFFILYGFPVLLLPVNVM